MRHILYLTTIFISLAGSAAESVDNPLRSEKEPLIYLSLEGGGMHMSAALELINLLEIEYNRPIAELVDGIIGASSGAIIGGHLLAPVPHRWSAQKLKDELPQMLVEGVKGSAMGGFLSWFSDSYPSFETLFKNNLGEASLKDALKHLLIASYNTLTEKMNIFDSQEESEGDIFLWNLVQASGAISAKMGPEWAWGAVDLRYGPDQISAGWVDSGMAPRDQKISTHEALASILKTKFPDRLIYIYSFSGGPCTFMGSPNNEQRVTQWQDGNINFVRFMPFYDDIPETTFGFSTWYKMLLDTSKENISIIDNHFFVPELLNSEEYKNMFEVIGQRFK